jgi:O-antigen ligase
VSTALLIVLIISVPIPYASVLPPGHLLVQTLSFAAAAAAFLFRPAGRNLGLATIAVVAMIALAGLGAFQLIPLSMPRLQQVAPVSAQTYRDANEILALFDRKPVPPKVSIAPTSTTTTILLTLAYAAAFTAAAIVCASRMRRRILVATLLVCSTVHVLIATATSGALTRIHGAFVNPNHLAGYLLMALSAAFALIWLELLKNRERAEGILDIGERLEKRAVPIIVRVLLWGIVAAGIGLTRSRGAILAALATTVILLIIAPLQRSMRVHRAALPAVVAVMAGLVFVAFTAGEAPLLRFLGSDPRDVKSDTRVLIWTASLEAFERSPTFGTGLGTFREAFRRVQPAEVRGLVEQAHNDFLQMLVTGGWVGAALVVIAVGSLLFLLIMRWSTQQHREENAIALAGIGALIALILHGIVEFNMSIPAIPVTLAVLLGVSWAAANYDRVEASREP